MDVRATTVGVKDWKVAKMRVAYLKEVIADRSRKAAENGNSDDEDGQNVGAEQDEEYLYELAEAMLVERVSLRRRRDSVTKAKKAQAEDDIPHPEFSGADIGLGSTVVTLNHNEKAAQHPFLANVTDYLDFSTHRWLDLGDDKTASAQAAAAGGGLGAVPGILADQRPGAWLEVPGVPQYRQLSHWSR